MALRKQVITIFFGCYIFSFSSCDYIDSLLEYKTGGEILSEVKAKNGEIAFELEQNLVTKTETRFLRFQVVGSQLIARGSNYKPFVASYCATQLYKRMKPFSINRIDGINVIFDNDDDTLANYKKFYYSKKEMEFGWRTFDNVRGLIDCALKNDINCELNFLDTSYFHISVEDINLNSEYLKEKIRGGYSQIFYFYGPHEVRSADPLKPAPECVSVTANIIRKDSSGLMLFFICPRYEADNKIIKIDTP